MFDILFGWRKASKCKKLIRRVQCRLKLLKNKRCSIVRQLRDDVAQLLRNGHDDIAFNRVEQLFKDESIVGVYDLLDHFCEFIVINLSYIRRHKDCPNDVNEAVSSLIFASARCGDLPELRVLRKLFGERYGQRFAMAALELLPGNLVNRQMKENLSLKSVSDDVKYKLVDEIARSCLQPGPLALEYCSELQKQQANKNGGDQIQCSDVQTNHNPLEGSQIQAPKGKDTEGKIVVIDFLAYNKNFIKEQCHSHQHPQSTSICSSIVLDSLPETVEIAMHNEEGEVEKCPQLDSPSEVTISSQSAKEMSCSCRPKNATFEPKERKFVAESSSEGSFQFPEETIYLDDIEEFQSPPSKDGNFQDQRLFLFKPSIIPTSNKTEDGCCEDHIEEYEPWKGEAGSRTSRKSGKRSRRNSISQDVDNPVYNLVYKSNHHKKNHKKISSDEMVNGCSLENPCYFCVGDDKESSPWKQKRKITTIEGFRNHYTKEEILRNVIFHVHCPCCRYTMNHELESSFLFQKPRINCKSCAPMRYDLTRQWKGNEMEGEPKGSDSLGSRASVCSCLSTTSQGTRNETKPPYSRAVTMPPERPKDSWNENVVRFNSFSSRQNSNLDICSSPHVHPKLPDYDELAAKFTALKKTNLQSKHY